MLDLIGRNEKLFIRDLNTFEYVISEEIQNSKILVIGGGGSIGRAVTKELFLEKTEITSCHRYKRE